MVTAIIPGSGNYFVHLIHTCKVVLMKACLVQLCIPDTELSRTVVGIGVQLQAFLNKRLLNRLIKAIYATYLTE